MGPEKFLKKRKLPDCMCLEKHADTDRQTAYDTDREGG